jgi:hypothetical protein
VTTTSAKALKIDNEIIQSVERKSDPLRRSAAESSQDRRDC